jgi:sugar phosphate isomerase/epimerase
MHPRVCLHQVAFVDQSTTAFIEHCRAIGVGPMTLVTPLLMKPGGLEEAQAALAAGGPYAHTINHPFATFPDLAGDGDLTVERLIEAIGMAATLGAPNIYLVTGGRGPLSWEDAAHRFSRLVARCLNEARARNVQLLVETASDFNVDIHIAHTLADTIRLAEMADIGLCLELHACWFEAGLREKFMRAASFTHLVQVSDYVLGDRSAPCRAVPGDGVIPLEQLIGDVLDTGYSGVFDLELVGPRIQAEGAAAATTRAAEKLSEILTKLGA